MINSVKTYIEPFRSHKQAYWTHSPAQLIPKNVPAHVFTLLPPWFATKCLRIFHVRRLVCVAVSTAVQVCLNRTANEATTLIMILWYQCCLANKSSVANTTPAAPPPAQKTTLATRQPTRLTATRPATTAAPTSATTTQASVKNEKTNGASSEGRFIFNSEH